MNPISEFPSFSLFPKELHLKIWRYAATNPTRIIPFHVDSNNNRSFIYIHTPIPLLSVNIEARNQTLKSYIKVSGASATDDAVAIAEGYNDGGAIFPPLYFNPFRDAVSISLSNGMDVRKMHLLLGGFQRYNICAGVRALDEDPMTRAFADSFMRRRGYIVKPAIEMIEFVGEDEVPGRSGEFWWKGRQMPNGGPGDAGE